MLTELWTILMSVRDGCVLLSIALGFSFGFSFSFASLGTIDVLRVLLSYLVIIVLARAVQPDVAIWAMNRAFPMSHSVNPDVAIR